MWETSNAAHVLGADFLAFSRIAEGCGKNRHAVVGSVRVNLESFRSFGDEERGIVDINFIRCVIYVSVDELR